MNSQNGKRNPVDANGLFNVCSRCLSIARSHAIIGNVANALALINHAVGLCQESSSKLAKGGDAKSQPLNVEVGTEAVASLTKLLNGELQRHRALVHINNLRNAEKEAAKGNAEQPLIMQLQNYPSRVNLRNIVEFPPKMELIPMKPIFLDVAWNYIDYPGKTSVASSAPAVGKVEEQEQSKKKGWFGFGR